MKQSRQNTAFTLVEVIVASGIVVVIMGVLLAMTDQTQRLVKSTSSKVEQFQDARVGFEAMTRRLSQATLNAFWDYKTNASGIPIGYQRSAELRFRSDLMSNLNPNGNAAGNLQPGQGVFFQAPNGLVSNVNQLGTLDFLMNTWGYYVELGSDVNAIPPFLAGKVAGRTRYRLMEFRQPSENLAVYNFQGNDPSNINWFANSLSGSNPPVRAMTENIVALIVLPRLSLADEQLWMQTNGKQSPPILAPLYSYSSTTGGTATNAADPVLNTMNQLPPVLQVVMVAIDEPSARMLQDRYGPLSNSPDSYLGIWSKNQTYFKDPSLLNDSSKGTAGDLSNYEKNVLIQKKVSYRIFATNVSIRGAKWSRN